MTHSFTLGIPSVGPYCSTSLRAEEVKVAVISFEGSFGEVAVNERDVKGNMSSLGFPARKERIPGVFSKGNKARTSYAATVQITKWVVIVGCFNDNVNSVAVWHGSQDGGGLTWSKFKVFRNPIGEEVIVILCREALDVDLRRGSP